MSDRETNSVGKQDWNTWPRYNAAVLGLRNYWYPVMWSRNLGRKPVPELLLGERIMFIRDGGKAYALHDRCVHRGVPLSLGSGNFGQRTFSKQEFPRTITCGYHGWTFDLKTGDLVAVLTDGPDSPICGKARVRTYPVEERLGLVWVYIGEGDPPPIEDDIPEEILQENAGINGQMRIRRGNWRFGAENGIDESHPRYLHRYSLWRFFHHLPCWTRTHIEAIENDTWITYVADEVHREAEFPGLGKWPRRGWWKKARGAATRISIRLPCTLRVNQPDWTIYSWFIPSDADHHRYVQLAVKVGRGPSRLAFKIRYWAYIRWINQRLFTNQDSVMLSEMDPFPERLFRPDLSIVAWRRLCEQGRGAEGVKKESPEELHESDLRKLTNEYTSAI